MPPLDNAKRERFCREYVIDLNATQAAIRAGYSKRTAGQGGDQLLKNIEVRERIAELQQPRIQALEITHESVLREIEETRMAAMGADQHSVALKASELKGKHIGMWREADKKDTGESLLQLLLEIAQRRIERDSPKVIEHE